MNEPIVVSGAGVVSSVGAGWEEFGDALFRGETGLRTSGVIKLGDDEAQVFEVADFTPQKWLGP